MHAKIDKIMKIKMIKNIQTSANTVIKFDIFIRGLIK